MDEELGELAFPKPERKAKKRRGLNPVRPAGKRNYTTAQRSARRQQDEQYRKHDRPGYLLGLARRQGRLLWRDAEIEGVTEQEKLRSLPQQCHPLCEASLPETGCDERQRLASTVHHRKGRAKRWGMALLLNDQRHFVGVCSECHAYIESHREWAYAEGWLLRRNDKEEA